MLPKCHQDADLINREQEKTLDHKPHPKIRNLASYFKVEFASTTQFDDVNLRISTMDKTRIPLAEQNTYVEDHSMQTSEDNHFAT